MVLVTHDESTFYANDARKERWVEQGEASIAPKGQGKSIMVSRFMCACHGTIKGVIEGEEKSSRTLFFPGGDEG